MVSHSSTYTELQFLWKLTPLIILSFSRDHSKPLHSPLGNHSMFIISVHILQVIQVINKGRATVQHRLSSCECLLSMLLYIFIQLGLWPGCLLAVVWHGEGSESRTSWEKGKGVAGPTHWSLEVWGRQEGFRLQELSPLPSVLFWACFMTSLKYGILT